MGQRGPKPGWKRGAADKVAPPLPAAPSAVEAAEQPRMSAADLANPAKLSGDALKKLAHTLGMAKSELARLTDERIRTQLKYLTHRKYEPAEA